MINKNNVLAMRRDIIQSYQSFNLKEASEGAEWQFAVYSANLHNMLPELPQSGYLPIFRNIHTNRRLSFLDIEQVTCPGLLSINGWDNAWATHIRDKPCIICTYHTGSYRLINYLLTKAKVPFSLVVSSRAYKQERKALKTMYTALLKEVGVAADLNLIDAEKSYSLIQMARAIKQGQSLVVYLDGNTGTKVGNNSYRNLLAVNFLSQQMAVRKGLASLAYHMSMPIYPILSMRTHHNCINYRHVNPIFPLANEAHATFTDRATRSLYTLLEFFVREHPEQWEGWLYLQNDLIYNTKAKKPIDLDDCKQWSIYRKKDKAYLLHRPSYESYAIPFADYPLLKGWFYKDL